MSEDNSKYHGGLNMFKGTEKDFISHKEYGNIKTIEIDISEGEILNLINHIPTVLSMDSEEFNKANVLINLINKLNKSWINTQNHSNILEEK